MRSLTQHRSVSLALIRLSYKFSYLCANDLSKSFELELCGLREEVGVS